MNRSILLLIFLVTALCGSDQVGSLVEQYPEILWLAGRDVRKTEEAEATWASHSERLFGEKFVEFDRTLMTLRCLHLILDGSDEAYEIFTCHQPEEERLLKNSFLSLHLEGQALLKSKWGDLSEAAMLQAMETSLVLGDIGKSEKARALFSTLGITAPDHDDFHGEVMAQGALLCPSFARLPVAAQELLKKTAHLAHYGHIFHLEAGPKAFTRLKESQIASEDPIALAFELFVYLSDVAGALGHVDPISSLSYKEKTHQGERSMQRAVWTLSDPKKTEVDAYNVHLNTLAAWMGLDSTLRTRPGLN